MYYLTHGVKDEDIEPMPPNQMKMFYDKLSPFLIQNFAGLCKNLEEEILSDHYSSLKKSVVDYILMDPKEKERLKIGATPISPPQRYSCM